MITDELEKEAEEWLNKWELCNKCENKVDCISNFSYCKKVVLQSYLASAEPREKRIAELEAQIERNKIDLAISEHDREHNDYELTEAYKKIEQLEKENAELKEQIRLMNEQEARDIRTRFPC